MNTHILSESGDRRDVRAKQPSSLARIVSVIAAILYGAMLCRIPQEHFKDFSNYIVYAEYSWERLLGLLSDGLLTTLSNEPVWLLINAALGSLLPSEEVVRLIIFFSASTVAWVVLRNHPRQFFWLLIFLLLPMVIKNHLIHLRQGLAISVFLLGWFASSKWQRRILLSLTPFIHASFFFVLPILVASKAMIKLRLGPDIRIIVFAMAGIGVGIGLGWLAALLGARQAYEYQFAMTDVSGLGFVLWLGVFILFRMEGRQFLRIHAFETGMIVFYLGTYWLIEVTARIFESSVLLVLIAGLSLTGWRLVAYKIIVCCVLFGLSWSMRTGAPAMGFGVG